MSKLYNFISAGDFENKIISKGNHFPSVDFSDGYLNKLCVLLHHQIQIEEIMSHLGISERDFELRIDELVREGLIKEEGREYVLSFPCITQKEGDEFYRLSKVAGSKIEKLIVDHLDEIRTKTGLIESLAAYQFEELSFFIISGVMLDFIQIDYVEKYFLQSERPSRNGSRYYFSLMQKTSAVKEPFGIYGNHCKGFGDFSLCMYGNDRYSTKNFITMNEEEIKSELHISNEGQLIKRIRTGVENDSIMTKGMEKIHLMNDHVMVPLITNEDYKLLINVARILTEDLIHVLEKERTALIEAHNLSTYENKTTFEEYFIWYYHFLYTYITDSLIDKGVITKPKNRAFSYILV